MRHLVLVILCGWLSGMQVAMKLHTFIPPCIPDMSCIQNNKYQVSHRYSCFSWWWAHSRPKHIEKRNRHTKKNCAPGRLYLQDYTRMSWPGSSVGIATDYGLEGPRNESRWGEIFRRPDRPWGPPSLLYNGYRFFPGVESGRSLKLTRHPF